MDRLLSRELFQLVVLDLMLPGEDGLTACRLREQNNQVPIIMLTARATRAAASRAWNWAPTTTWPPFNPRELLARIKARAARHRWCPARLPVPTRW